MNRLIFICFVATVSACTTNPDVAIKIEKNSKEFKILLGDFTGSFAPAGNYKDGLIHVTDGAYSCNGKSNTGKLKRTFTTNSLTHLFRFTCDDGATGQVLLKITMRGHSGNITGIGIGKLNNGSKIKVVVGDMSGTLKW